MNISFLLQHKVLGVISKLFHGYAGTTSPPSGAMQNASVAPVFIAACAYSTGSSGIKHINLPPRPLRVVRVVDAGQSRSSVGRMVISGRMADVCAELDRLAAHEAAAA